MVLCRSIIFVCNKYRKEEKCGCEMWVTWEGGCDFNVLEVKCSQGLMFPVAQCYQGSVFQRFDVSEN